MLLTTFSKGRVERLFGTLQDRLVKERRLHRIATLEQANRFLWEHYLPSHNARFAFEPLRSNDAHRPLPAPSPSLRAAAGRS